MHPELKMLDQVVAVLKVASALSHLAAVGLATRPLLSGQARQVERLRATLLEETRRWESLRAELGDLAACD